MPYRQLRASQDTSTTKQEAAPLGAALFISIYLFQAIISSR
jgi:hypothetical protein